MMALVDFSQEAGTYTPSAPVWLTSLLCCTDSWLQLESMLTDLA